MDIKRTIMRSPVFPFLIKGGLTNFVLDLYWGNNDAALWKDIQTTGRMPPPQSLWFEPTNRCVLQCIFCHQRERRKTVKQELSLNEIDCLLSAAEKMGIRKVDLIGGEIFIRKDIFQIFESIQRHKMSLKIGTSGVLLDDDTIAAVRRLSCVESIVISIDGNPETHNRLRNSPHAFNRALNALQKLRRSSFMLGIASVILPDNKKDIEFLLNLAKTNHVDRITFMPEMFYSEQEIQNTIELMHWGSYDELYLERSERDIPRYAQQMCDSIAVIELLRKKIGVFAPIFPRSAQKYPYDFAANTLAKKKRLICRHFSSLTVLENGDVLICPFIYKKMGNILLQPIETVWNCETMMELRKKILSENLLPICRRCCCVDYI